MTSEEAVMSFCMLSARFSRGFPEKGMAWCCVLYSCVKVFTALASWYSGLGPPDRCLGRGCFRHWDQSPPETGASASPERLFWPLFWQPRSPGSPVREACVAPQRPIPGVLPVTEYVDQPLEGLVLHPPPSPFLHIHGLIVPQHGLLDSSISQA